MDGFPRSPSGKYRWIDARLLPPLPGSRAAIDAALEKDDDELNEKAAMRGKGKKGRKKRDESQNFRVNRKGVVLPWEKEDEEGSEGPRVDYTKWRYSYSPLPPSGEVPFDGTYPPLRSLGEMLREWPQDDIDNPPNPVVENLAHFDYEDEDQMRMALEYRKRELPFKVINVSEVIEAGKKWTDEYVSSHFDGGREGILSGLGLGRGDGGAIPKSHGHCQESPDSFFAFYQPPEWDVAVHGTPPTVNNDFTYARWAQHARYADRVGLGRNKRHYYWQSGVPRDERLKLIEEGGWTFISRDLPSFSSPKPTFFGFEPNKQKGIQCRFGERGVTAATHYDAGRNMIAMIRGAKRYILSPPKECRRLGVVTKRNHPIFRHSLLNFAHLDLLNREDKGGGGRGDRHDRRDGDRGGNVTGDNKNEKGNDQRDEDDDNDARSLPPEEREWLELSRDSFAVDTVLKAGEVLYVPSHWFHYIVSLQKSAQCNTRSGRERGGTPFFGGYDDVEKCLGGAA